jgi:hypothetical protein
MKRAIFFLFILFAFIGCHKEDDDTDQVCTSNGTTIYGKIITANNTPVKDINVNFQSFTGNLLYSKTRYIKDTKTNGNGFYSMNFNIEDGERTPDCFFELKIDLSNLDPKKFLLPDFFNGYTGTSFSGGELKNDTVIEAPFYIPMKEYITIHLKNYKPVQTNDWFEVQTFFPWGMKSDEKKMLNTEYGISSSGYDNFVAKNESQTFRVPVARNDTNIIRIVKVKNGVAIPEDHKLFVSENNNIELTYKY